MNLKLAKFTIRVSLTIIMMGIGATIFFTSDKEAMKIVGSNMITAGWAAWVSMGSSKIKRPEELKEVIVDETQHASLLKN